MDMFLQPLEARSLFSVLVHGNIVRITGTPEADRIELNGAAPSLAQPSFHYVNVVLNGKKFFAEGKSDSIPLRIILKTAGGADSIDVNIGYTPAFIDIRSGSGNDRVTVISGSEVIHAGPGNDVISVNTPSYGRAGTVFGEDGDDTITGGSGDDLLLGGPGDDSIFGGDETDPDHSVGDTLRGGEGDDTLVGGAGHDLLRGDEGQDALQGGAGDDTLIGGPASDQLIGGPGNDRFSKASATALPSDDADILNCQFKALLA